MKRLVFSIVLAAASAFAQYKLEPAGAPPQDLPAPLRDALQKDGARISGPGGVWCEVWFRTQVPSGANNEQNVSFTDIPQGTLLGVIRFPNKAADRRGDAVKPGVYTMRLSFFPVDGAHQGVSQTRDFVLLSPVAQDTDLNAAPAFKQLVSMSEKASGIAHPAVLNVWKGDSPVTSPSLKQEGQDWMLYDTVGGKPIVLIVVGTYTA